MNVPTNWSEKRVSDDEIIYRSQHTFGGRIEVKATRTWVDDKGWVIEWDRPNDVPNFLVERAREALGWKS